MTVDRWGRTLVTTDPDGVQTATVYTAVGDVATTADALGNTTAYQICRG